MFHIVDLLVTKKGGERDTDNAAFQGGQIPENPVGRIIYLKAQNFNILFREDIFPAPHFIYQCAVRYGLPCPAERSFLRGFASMPCYGFKESAHDEKDFLKWRRENKDIPGCSS